MADGAPARAGPPVPTAIHLEEPRFPSFGGPTDSTSDRTLAKSATDGGSPNTLSQQTTPQNETNDVRSSPPNRLLRLETDITSASHPPMLRKSMTEQGRPRIKATGSWLDRRKARAGAEAEKKQERKSAPAPVPMERQTTLRFDPYSTDSSSSSDEDEPASPVEPVNTEAPLDSQPPARNKSQHNRPFSKFLLGNDEFHSKGRISKQDGRLKLSINETLNSGYFAKTLGAGLKKHFRYDGDDDEVKSPVHADDVATRGKIAPEDDDMENEPSRRVKLNIVIIVIGSRGDIQPFLRIGKILKEDYGHRVRIATHPAFKQFVEEDAKLEFFSVGGDPSELMAFMVKNPGLVPNLETIKDGEIGKRRAAMYEMFLGMWRACVNVTDDENDSPNMKMLGNKHPFIADAIIANPPSFAPPHIAERLGIPLHMMFTFPYTPTVQFPHPLANIKSGNVDAKYTNFMSYPLVEMMTWQGLGDLINRFRKTVLFQEEVSTLWAPGQLYRLKVPYTYMWSPALVPKPKDWGPEVDVTGFVFLDLASSFKPPEDLAKFLDAGPPPVYIGFGSIVVDNPDKFTKLIFEAVKMAGCRALVSKGWGGLGDEKNTPDNIYMLENTPHDWLFPRVSAVVHHGGAGTTAIGLKCAKPTMIVPFFGDQPFWGAMVSKAKAGAHECIPYKKLTADRLAEGIKQCLTEEAKVNVAKIAESIEREGDGALNAVRSFHRSLPLKGEHNMRCEILENRVATWKLKNSNVRLSSLAAELLVDWKKIKWNELRLLRHYEWNDFGGPGEPISGAWGAVIGTAGDIASGVGMVPVNMGKSIRKREKYYEKRHALKKRQKHRKETLARANAELKADGAMGNSNTSDGANDQALLGKANAGNKPGGPKRTESTLSTLTEPDENLAEELFDDAGEGFKKTGSAIVAAPVRFMVSLTQGFHNAPRLYGDETVRRPPRITGFHSGLRAGRDEFIYGVYDGFTGIVTQPYRMGKSDGVMGGLAGVGMGIGGFVLKDIAALMGPMSYTLKGLQEEALKKYQPTDYLRRARIVQGQKELEDLGPGPRRGNRRNRREGNGDGTEDEDAYEKRRQIELQVSKGWEALQVRIAQDKNEHKSGIRASLLGHSHHKEGTAVMRRRSRAHVKTLDTIEGPKNTATAPISEAEPVVTKPRKADSAPSKSLRWKERSKKKQSVDAVPEAEKEQAKRDAVAKRHVPNVFEASLEGNGRPVGSTSRSRHRHDEEERQRGRGRTESDVMGGAEGEPVGRRSRSLGR